MQRILTEIVDAKQSLNAYVRTDSTRILSTLF